MKKYEKRKKFLDMPQYPGGKNAFLKFIKENLQYPDEARENKIEGDVHLIFEIKHTGEIQNAKVVKGIGYGCDEEALRLVNMLKYEKTKNKGVRVTAHKRLKIGFKLDKDKLTVQYSIQSDEESSDNKNNNHQTRTYTYTIRFS